ncbi:GvpL/GvpF family gas vesicle protein [Streptomyces bambusae]|uniref:GvpL/GvpF family gas vesicle protein n=1 Tax=Streptomyces bambusae TaxID=1550616 RepID=UPI001CFD9F9B|nr:GvpL/GvpF family gas vesicle protein [Streptomyces bambusae]MCB5164270.1 GvpL/GvpF family gas vesicle protein [Streptomyces bambusae]
MTARRDPPAGVPPGSAAQMLTYVYAVTPDVPPPVPGPVLTGVAGRPVGFLRLPGSGPVAFAVSTVPASKWNEHALRAHFEDLEWLQDTARAHHRVVESLAARTTVLPMRMATLYDSRARALEALAGQAETFAVQLARLSGRTEYGVKIYMSPVADAPAPADTDTGPGRAYLQARRVRQRTLQEHYGQAQVAADRIAEAGRRWADGHACHPVQSGPLTAGTAEENVLNDAYLVAVDRAAQFRAAVEDAARHLPGVRLEVTGPWAPYSFAAPSTPPPEP